MTSIAAAHQVAAPVLPTVLVCAGCGYRAPADELPFRCPAARSGDDIDHLMRRVLQPARLEWPAGGEANPYIRYRTLFHWYHLACAAGLSDEEISADVRRLDDAVAAVDGRGFRATPFTRNDGLAVWIKDETGNVSGSHKGRHLFGTLLALHFSPGGGSASRPLAIASCGNAALAAAVVARAAGRELLVFVPVEADQLIVYRLHELGANVEICERLEVEQGDPTVRRMREVVADGAIPFTCQGNENGLAIEGGLTLGYELADAMREKGVRLDQLFVQVGGGALASSVYQGLSEARALGVIDRLPAINTVQTRGVAPLARAYRIARGELDRGRAAHDVFNRATRQRSRFMRPWPHPRASIATGILDDETYDWLAVVRAMVATGGRPLVVDEHELRAANDVAHAQTGIEVDPTGSAGLAGLLQLRRSGALPSNSTSAVLFTGARRT